MTQHRRFAWFLGLVVTATSCGKGGGGGGSSADVVSPPNIPGPPPGSPTLAFSTFLGGSNDEWIRDVFVDAQGHVYVAGGTQSSDFPTTVGAYDRSYNGTHDVFVAEFSPDGSQLIFSTFLGGPNYDRAYAIEVDDQGYVYVAGRAGAGFPTTAGVVQPNFGGDVNPNALYGPQDGFITKLTPDGSSVVWSTYMGTDDDGILRDMDIDSAGRVYAAGFATRPHWAITPGAFQTTLQGPKDGFAVALTADAKQVIWGSYYGGSGLDGGNPSVRVGDDGTMWVLGGTQSDDFPTTPGCYQPQRGGIADLVVLRFAPGGGSLVFGTCFGGSQGDYTETHGLWVEPSGVVTIAATTLSNDLPFVKQSIPPSFQPKYGGTGGAGSGANTNYAGDGFVAKLSADGKTLLAFTYLGAAQGEGIEGVAVDAQGRVWVSGATYSTAFPVTPDALQIVKKSASDSFLTRLAANLTGIEYSTYFGGNSEDYARSLNLGANGLPVSAGMTQSTNFPTSSTAFQKSFGGGSWDAFLFQIEP
jgi:hypothetical protein